MVSDLNTPNSSKSLLMIMLAAIVIVLVVVLLYLSARQASFAKTEPYNVSIQLQGVEGSVLSAEYDYGYGFNRGHQQTFDINSSQRLTINFTVSAWKALMSLRLTSNDNVNIYRVVINKGAIKSRAVDTSTLVSDVSPLVLNDLSEKLLGDK